MRICMTHYAFHPTVGGVESHLLDLGAALVSQGHEVFALVGSLQGSPNRERLNGINIYRHDLLNPLYVRRHKEKYGVKVENAWPPMIDALKSLYSDFVKEYNIDLVHAHNLHLFLPEYGLALTSLYREELPTFLTIHGSQEDSICKGLLQRTQWCGVIAISQYIKRKFLGQVASIKLIYSGIDLARFAPRSNPKSYFTEVGIEDRPIIIHPARMLPEKGILSGVRAMARVCKVFPGAILIITDTPNIVDGRCDISDYKREVVSEIKRLKLQDNIWLRPFSYFDLHDIYNSCDVVIYPTLGEESFGLVPVEAMACAKPVIVTRSGGMVESVVDGKTGFVIEKEDVEALAERMCLLLSNRGLARRMGRAGRKRVEQMFNSERMVQETVGCYEDGLAHFSGIAEGQRKEMK